MTYKENSNVFLTNSGTVCPTLLPEGFHRNSFSTYSNETSLNVVSPDHESSRDASGIVGTVTHIHNNNGQANWEFMYPGSIVRNGDYIYMYHRVEPNGDQPPWELWILEYQISTRVQREIFVMQNDNSHGDYEIATGWGTFISIIEDRKVLVCDNGKDDDDDPPYYYVWIVDFDADTCTLDFSFPLWNPDNEDIQHLIPTSAVIKVSNGDLHLLVWGEYRNDAYDPYPYGWYIFDKNYTQNGEWIETNWTRDYGRETYGDSDMCPAIIVNHKYLVIPCTYETTVAYDGGYHFHTTYLFHVYDIDTKGVSHTHGNDEDSNSWVLARESWIEDATNHNLYIELKFGANDPDYDTYEFDPAICTLNLTPISNGARWMVSSNTHVYDWDSSDNIYRTDTQSLQNNYPRPTYVTNLSVLMDDNAEVIWFIDGATLVAYNIITDTIVRSIATGIIAYRIGIVHLGDCLVLTTLDEAYGSIVDYYLVR
jgi:hypothetical protein